MQDDSETESEEENEDDSEASLEAEAQRRLQRSLFEKDKVYIFPAPRCSVWFCFCVSLYK